MGMHVDVGVGGCVGGFGCVRVRIGAWRAFALQRRLVFLPLALTSEVQNNPNTFANAPPLLERAGMLLAAGQPRVE
jgi:hypothetical protein